MSLFEQLEKDFITAYKSKDSVRLGVIRFLKTALKNYQVEHLKEPDEAALLDIIAKQCKQRLDSIEQYTKASRPELAAKEDAELQVLKGYMPEPLSAEDLAGAIAAAAKEIGATGMKDMGKVMQALNAAHKGRFDGKSASDAVKAYLSSM